MAENDPAAARPLRMITLAQDDLVTLLSRHTLNDYSRVQGLLHFCGGEERSSNVPNSPCHTVDEKCLKDTARTFQVVQKELFESKRRTGENIRAFLIRLESLRDEMSALRPGNDSLLNDIAAGRLLEAFPPAFEYILTEDEKNDPCRIMIRGYEYIRAYPELKLSDADIAKENEPNIRTTKTSGPRQRRSGPPRDTHPPSQRGGWHTAPPTRYYWKEYVPPTCYTCGYEGHMARDCSYGWQHRGAYYPPICPHPVAPGETLTPRRRNKNKTPK